MKVITRCPNPECGKTASVPADYVGRTVRCPACRKKFRVAETEAGGLTSAVRTAAEADPSAGDTAPSHPPVTVPPAATPAQPGLPAPIGRFEVRDRLGAGAFGTVYRAYDP